jgi:CelD/BcsL family acetyltransferase involved in cellulose biosynthesis
MTSSASARAAAVPRPLQWVLKNKRMKFAFGGFVLYAVRVRALVLNGIFAELPEDPDQTPLPLHDSHTDVRAALILSHPVRQELPGIAFTRDCIRYVPHQYQRFYLDVNGSFDEYLSRLSPQRRKHLRRDVRRFRQAGTNQAFREYSMTEEIAEFYRLAREVSSKTYQERLVDAGLPDTREFLDDLMDRAKRDAVRGYILFHNGAPAAYQYCPAEGDVLVYERVGYDPDLRQLGPGTVLLFLVIEQLFSSRRFRRLDFGAGEFDYKKAFGTGYLQCADIYYFRRTLSNAALVTGHAVVSMAWSGVTAVLDRMGVRAKLRRAVRSRYATR